MYLLYYIVYIFGMCVYDSQELTTCSPSELAQRPFERQVLNDRLATSK